MPIHKLSIIPTRFDWVWYIMIYYPVLLIQARGVMLLPRMAIIIITPSIASILIPILSIHNWLKAIITTTLLCSLDITHTCGHGFQIVAKRSHTFIWKPCLNNVLSLFRELTQCTIRIDSLHIL